MKYILTPVVNPWEFKKKKKMIEGDRELSAMIQELWDNDINRLRPGIDYRISLRVILKSFLCEVF